MTSPPEDWNTCPCCGTEFESHTYDHTPRELRQMWIRAGMPWFSPVDRPPRNWNPIAQLIKAELTNELLNPSGARIGYQQKDVWDVRRLSWLSPEDKTVDTAKGLGYAKVAGVSAV
jgi:hypothetical protein